MDPVTPDRGATMGVMRDVVDVPRTLRDMADKLRFVAACLDAGYALARPVPATLEDLAAKLVDLSRHAA